MRHRLSVLFLAGLLMVSGCASALGPGDREVDGPEFSTEVLPVIQDAFVPLLTEDTGLDATSWAGLMRGSNEGEVVIPFDPDRSLLVERAEAAGSNAPTADQIDLVRAWIAGGARSDDGEIPYADSEQLLYVCNQGDAVISVIDMESNVVVRTIDLQELGFSENARPHHIAVNGSGSRWFVSLIGENTVLEFDRSNELVGQTAFEVPGLLALDPASDRLVVGRSMSAVNPPQRIGLIDLTDMNLEEVDVFFQRPHALAFAPDGGHVYSSSLAANRMASIDPATLDIELTDVPGPLHSLVQFAVSPDGGTMIAGGEMSGALLFFDLTEPAAPSVRATIDLGGAPWHPSFQADGARAFVPQKTADALAVVDVTSASLSEVVTGAGFSQPHGSALRPDGRYLYVTNNNLDGGYTPRYGSDGDPPGTVVVIDTRTLDVVKVLEVENYPTGIGTRPAY